MSTLYIVLPASLALALVAVLAFRWATRRGQYDDLETPAWRAILDDAPVPVRSPSPSPTPDRPGAGPLAAGAPPSSDPAGPGPARPGD